MQVQSKSETKDQLTFIFDQEVSNRKRGKLHEEEFEDVSGRDSDWLCVNCQCRCIWAAAQEVKTWSGLKTGISSEFEAGHKGTGQYGTDTSRIITQCWAACQDGANAARDIVYSPKVGTSDVGRYKASCEHWNNPLVTTSKYYGWYY